MSFNPNHLASMLSEGEKGAYSIKKFTVKSDNIRAAIDGIPCGEYVSLRLSGDILMSNTPMEINTNSEFARCANGDVLIGGLGLGMIVLWIQDNPKIKSITVLEKSQEVIDLVKPQLPLNEKVSIIQADVFDWIPPKDKRFDTIYLDIWSGINSDIYNEEMKPLKARYRKWLRPLKESPQHFLGCWAEHQARYNQRLR